MNNSIILTMATSLLIGAAVPAFSGEYIFRYKAPLVAGTGGGSGGDSENNGSENDQDGDDNGGGSDDDVIARQDGLSEDYEPPKITKYRIDWGEPLAVWELYNNANPGQHRAQYLYPPTEIELGVPLEFCYGLIGSDAAYFEDTFFRPAGGLSHTQTINGHNLLDPSTGYFGAFPMSADGSLTDRICHVMTVEYVEHFNKWMGLEYRIFVSDSPDTMNAPIGSGYSYYLYGRLSHTDDTTQRWPLRQHYPESVTEPVNDPDSGYAPLLVRETTLDRDFVVGEDLRSCITVDEAAGDLRIGVYNGWPISVNGGEAADGWTWIENQEPGQFCASVDTAVMDPASSYIGINWNWTVEDMVIENEDVVHSAQWAISRSLEFNPDSE